MSKKREKEEQTLEEKLKMAIIPKEEEPYKVPDNWVWTRLGEVFNIERGGSPRPIKDFLSEDEDAINWIKIGDTEVGRKYIDSTKEKIKKEGLKKSRYVRKGDLLLTNSMSFGRPYILNCDGCIHDGWLVMQPLQKEIIREYFYYLFNSRYMYNTFSNSAKGSTVKNLNKDIVKTLNFPLPPIEEQKRIVNKLDYFFDKIQKVKEIIEELKEKNEARKESILSKAFTGELTAKWRADNIHSAKELLNKINDEKLSNWEQECQKAEAEGRKKPTKPKLKSIDEMIVPNDEIPYEIPNNWVWTRLGDIAEINMGQSPEGSTVSLNKENGIGLIGGASDMGEVFPSITRYTTKPTKLSTKDDIIISVRATLGKPIFSNGVYCLGRGVCGIKSDIYLKEMLKHYFNLIEKELYKMGTGSTFSQISREIISNLIIPLPPIEEQKEIVRILDNIFTKENLINELISLEDKIQVLEKSILSKAFRGELGTNSKDDIEAMELLKEIL